MYKIKLLLFVNQPIEVQIITNGWPPSNWSRVGPGTFSLFCPRQFAGKKVFCPPVVYRDSNDVLRCFQMKESDTTTDYLVFENWNPETGGAEDTDSNPIPLTIELS